MAGRLSFSTLLPVVVSLHSPLRGRATRCSDDASFWLNGYPTFPLSDTDNLRNLQYHRPSDRVETLDLGFATEVADAGAAWVRLLARA